MNRIERMVAEMCPEGVEKRPLGEFVRVETQAVPPASMGDGTINLYSLPSFDRNLGPEATRSMSVKSAKTRIVSPCVLVSKLNPHIVRVWDVPIVDGESYCSTEFVQLVPLSGMIDRRFLYFIAICAEEMLGGSVSGSTNSHKRLHRGDFLSFRVRVPPIEIQWETVDILDSFTRFEAELEARRRQFRLVADRFIELAAGEQARIADHVDFIRGVTYSKSDEVSAGYGRGVLRASNIGGLSRRIVFDDLRTVSSGVKFKDQQLLHLDDVLMVGSSGSLVHLGKSALVREDDLKSGPMLFGAFMMVLRVRDTLDARFLFHLLGSSRFQEFTSSDSSSATINNLNPTKIGRFVFSLPPFEVQRRIADVLDDFDALVNDLSSSLPAEIAARRQQYEYYRDRLLTFPEKK